MIKYLHTAMARTYNRHNQDYLNAMIRGDLTQYNIGQGGLLAVNSGGADVPTAYIPQVIPKDHDSNTLGRAIVMIDATKVRSNEVDLRKTMGMLTAAWEGGDTVFDQTRRFLTKAYTNWVSRGLAQRFGLPFQDVTPLKVYLATYFWCTHTTPDKILPQANSLSAVADATGIPATAVNDIWERHNLRNFEDTLNLVSVINMAKDISPEVRTKLTAESVMATMSGSWFSETGTFYSNLALEYPPAFATLAYHGLTERGYQKTRLGEVVKQYAGGRNNEHGVSYAKNIGSLIAGLLKAGK